MNETMSTGRRPAYEHTPAPDALTGVFVGSMRVLVDGLDTMGVVRYLALTERASSAPFESNDGRCECDPTRNPEYDRLNMLLRPASPSGPSRRAPDTRGARGPERATP